MGVDLIRRGSAAIVLLNWPERRNALGPAEAREIAEAIAVGYEEDVRGLVLAGRGTFCAGGDLKQLLALVHQPTEVLREAVYGSYQQVIRLLLEVPVPTVAAIDGAAIGLGIDIALACDMRFISSNGWLMQGWGKMGLIPGTGGWLLWNRISPNSAWEVLAGQPIIDAQQAVDFGLAEGTDTGTALDAALARLESLGTLPRAALAGYAQLNRLELRAVIEHHFAVCIDIQLGLLQSAEFRELAELAQGGKYTASS